MKIKSYTKDILYQSSGNIIAQTISVIGLPIIARLFDPTTFGSFTIINQISYVLSILISLRLEYFVVSSKNNNRAISHVQQTIKMSLLLTFVLIVLFFVFPFYNMFGISKGELLMTPLIGLFLSISILFQNYSQFTENYKISGVSDVFNKIGYFISSMILGLIYINAYSLSFGLIIGYLSKSIYIISKFKKNIFNKNKLFIPKKTWKRSLSFSGSSIINFLAGYIPMQYIAIIYGLDLLGEFNMAASLLYLPTSLIGGAIGQVFYQRAFKEYSSTRSFYDISIHTFKTTILIGFPFFIGCYFLFPFLIPFLLGSKWVSVILPFKILVFSSFISFLSLPLDRTAFIIGKIKYPIIWNSIRVLSAVILMFVTEKYNFEYIFFLKLYVIQLSGLYLIDLIFSLYFSKTVKFENIKN